MNKYQEAIVNVRFKLLGQYEDRNLDILEELVEKATPKKPFLKHVEYSFCPNCHNTMSYDYNDKPMYCKDCGQALSWPEIEGE